MEPLGKVSLHVPAGMDPSLRHRLAPAAADRAVVCGKKSDAAARDGGHQLIDQEVILKPPIGGEVMSDDCMRPSKHGAAIGFLTGSKESRVFALQNWASTHNRNMPRQRHTIQFASPVTLFGACIW